MTLSQWLVENAIGITIMVGSIILFLFAAFYRSQRSIERSIETTKALQKLSEVVSLSNTEAAVQNETTRQMIMQNQSRIERHEDECRENKQIMRTEFQRIYDKLEAR